MRVSVVPPTRFEADVTPPGDKSIGHRALLLNAAAVGEARITGFPRGKDTLATLAILRALGVRVREERRSRDGVSSDLSIRGQGIQGLQEPERILNARNSGTAMRLLLGLLAGAPLTATLTGDLSLRSRPMGRVVEPLRRMSAQIWGREDGNLAPLTVKGTHLQGIGYEMPVASAQLKSALLLAGLSAKGPTTLQEPALSRDHTERMLVAMGVTLKSTRGRIYLEPGVPRAVDVRVPADISSAAPWLVAGAIHPNARVTVRGVGVNPTRTGILDVLQQMGAKVQVTSVEEDAAEPIADITVESSELRGVEIGGAIIPRLIDELPLLALAATQASGETTIRDAQELRVKESDRIATTVGELNRLGARLEEQPDGMVIYGHQRLQGVAVRSHGDHRLAMTLAIAGIVANGEVGIDGAEVVDVSYPAFWPALQGVLTSS